METLLNPVWAIVIEPSGDTKVVDLAGKELPVLQEAIGGFVTAISLSENATLWLNEEGYTLKLSRNRFAELIWDAHLDRKNMIVGTTVLTGGIDNNGDLHGLSSTMIDRVQNDIKFVQIMQPWQGRADELGIL